MLASAHRQAGRKVPLAEILGRTGANVKCDVAAGLQIHVFLRAEFLCPRFSPKSKRAPKNVKLAAQPNSRAQSLVQRILSELLSIRRADRGASLPTAVSMVVDFVYALSAKRREEAVMPVELARREFLAGMVAMTAAKATSRFAPRDDANSPFRVAVINDEISQDFGHACEVASREFGMDWIELRGMWKKNIVNLDEKEVAEAQRILEKYQLKVTDIASPLFKVDWPGRRNPNSAKPRVLARTLRLTSRTKFWSAPSRWRNRFRPIACAASISGGWRIRLRIARPSTTNCGMRPPRRRRRESSCCWKMKWPATRRLRRRR